MQQQQTYDLRGQLTQQPEARDMYTSDEEQSVLEDDSDGEDRNNSGGEEYMDEDDDRSSELSIPNESIDFDLVYALHSFAATVEGQANVVKGDSLFLMDDSNSYWWLVRVLKTQEVGYIPAENIETPFERLARLNKHRNVDLASATQAEFNAEGKGDRLRKEEAAAAAAGNTARFAASPSPTPGTGPRSASRASASSKSSRRSVFFTPAFHVHRYPPAVWHDDEEDDEDVEWDDEGYSDEDPEIAEAFPSSEDPRLQNMEPDDGMSWEDGAVDAMRGGAPPPPLALLPGGQQPGLRMQTSREQLLLGVDAPSSASPVSPRTFDPLMATETRKLSATPNIARGADEDGRIAPSTQSSFQSQQQQQQQVQTPQGPMLPSAVMQQQAEERNRTREEIEILKEEARKRGKVVPGSGPSSTTSTPTRPGPQGQQATQGPTTPQSGGKLRKDKTPEKSQQQAQESPAAGSGSEEKGTKKRSLVSSLFGRGKKDKKNGSSGGIDSADVMRASDDSARSSGLAAQQGQQQGAPQPGRGEGGGRDVAMQDGTQSPVTEAARAQQANYRNSTNPRTTAAMQAQMRGQAAAQAIAPVITQSPVQEPGTPQQIQRGTSQDTNNSQSPQDSSPLSQYSSTLRQRDQAQQAAYLNRSPASSSEVRPSYGLMSASSSSRGTPFGSMGSSGSSLAPSDSTMTGGRRPRPGSLVLSPSSDGPGVPDLSVIRVFAGQHVQTEATFKTVLLNASTSSDELVKQAMQRFRLGGDHDGDAGDYYLTIKQLEGQSAVLRPHEKPLVVFEGLVEAAMEMPKVKRSSVGSISSVASNLSMHPAIKKLPMNDFTDDSAVKFYLNRRLGPEESESEGAYGDEMEETIIAEGPSFEVGTGGFGEGRTGLAVPPHLTINNNGVGAERFSSPSARFALQVIIQPEDLPDDMVFDPQTEAIVFKHTLRNRGPVVQSPDVSMSERRKVFMFPRNVTVAEVIELGLERFGILEGVVDGGDEVEDKLSKRQSSLRVRYALRVQINGQERELSPSHRVIEAFPKPPQMKMAEKPRDAKRRSVDFSQLLGSIDDVQPSDPVFVLKRAVAYRSSRNRSSAPLDDVALQHLRRDIAHASEDSSSSADAQPKQMSKQELIAAQRAASRANQKAMLSAQSNSVRGVDVRLPNNALLRSQRSGADDRMRYSYVDGTGEMYDISDIVEEEWRNVNVEGVSPNGRRNGDLLEGIVGRAASSPSQQAGLGEKLERVISKATGAARSQDHLDVRDLEPPPSATGSMHSVSSAYSNVDEEIIRKPAAAAARIMGSAANTGGSRSGTPTGRRSVASPTPGSRSATPTAPPPRSHLRNTSISSTTSGSTPTKSTMQPSHSPGKPSLSGPPSRAPSSTGHGSSKLSKKGSMPQIPKDDFGVSTMLALLEVPNLLARKPPLPPLDDAEALLFGRELDIESLHPDIRKIYAPSFEKLAEMDRILDDLYASTVMAV